MMNFLLAIENLRAFEPSSATIQNYTRGFHQRRTLPNQWDVGQKV